MENLGPLTNIFAQRVITTPVAHSQVVWQMVYEEGTGFLTETFVFLIQFKMHSVTLSV